MPGFDLAAGLITIAAVSGYLNHRILKLPATTGTLAVALLSSLLVSAINALVPSLALRATINDLLGNIDFNQILMRGMLSFLLFAGALHLDLEGLLDNKWTIGVLATLGVAISTAIIGILMHDRSTVAGPLPHRRRTASVVRDTRTAVQRLDSRRPREAPASVGDRIPSSHLLVVLIADKPMHATLRRSAGP